MYDMYAVCVCERMQHFLNQQTVQQQQQSAASISLSDFFSFSTLGQNSYICVYGCVCVCVCVCIMRNPQLPLVRASWPSQLVSRNRLR